MVLTSQDRETAYRHATAKTFPSLKETLISVWIALVLLIGVVWNLPDAEIKRRLQPVLQPIASAAGLEQVWQMYAPEPIRRREAVDVVVTMADRSQRTWTYRRGDPVLGPFAWYHWQKLKEQMAREEAIRASVVHWVVRGLAGPSERAVRVQMLLRTEVLPPPGDAGPGDTALETLYDEALTGRP
jgi:hypothetical protein